MSSTCPQTPHNDFPFLYWLRSGRIRGYGSRDTWYVVNCSKDSNIIIMIWEINGSAYHMLIQVISSSLKFYCVQIFTWGSGPLLCMAGVLVPQCNCLSSRRQKYCNKSPFCLACVFATAQSFSSIQKTVWNINSCILFVVLFDGDPEKY